jgi:hypothetical protein
VLDEDTFDVQTLEFSIRLSVLEELQENAGTLLGPATLCMLEGLSLGSPSNTRVVSVERNALLVVNNISEVSLSISKLSTLESGAGLVGILEVHTKINPHSLAGLGGFLGGTSVLDHFRRYGSISEKLGKMFGRIVTRRAFAAYKSAAPETPLAHYRAEKHAISSINHRLFYINM